MTTFVLLRFSCWNSHVVSGHVIDDPVLILCVDAFLRFFVEVLFITTGYKLRFVMYSQCRMDITLNFKAINKGRELCYVSINVCCRTFPLCVCSSSCMIYGDR